MSATMRQMAWTVVVADTDHWAHEHRAAADATPSASYDDWVCDQLRDVMAAAAETWIAFNSDLFRGGLE